MSSVPDQPPPDETECEGDALERVNLSWKADLDELEEAVELLQAVRSVPVANWTKAQTRTAARFFAQQFGRQEAGLLSQDIRRLDIQRQRFEMARILARLLSEPPKATGAPERIRNEQIEVFRVFVETARKRGGDVPDLARRIYRMPEIRKPAAEWLGLNWAGQMEGSFVKAFQMKWRSIRRKLMKNK